MIIQAPVGLAIIANIITGIASFSLQVPGTFSGYPPTDSTQARFFDHLQICADAQNDSDYIDAIDIEDTDGVIPSPVRAAFPDYPVIVNFSTDSGVATGVKAGYYLTNGCAVIGALGQNFPTIPSGLYLKATIHGGIGQSYHMNLVWGRSTTL